jgi:hypothetical protein
MLLVKNQQGDMVQAPLFEGWQPKHKYTTTQSYHRIVTPFRKTHNTPDTGLDVPIYKLGMTACTFLLSHECLYEPLDLDGAQPVPHVKQIKPEDEPAHNAFVKEIVTWTEVVRLDAEAQEGDLLSPSRNPPSDKLGPEDVVITGWAGHTLGWLQMQNGKEYRLWRKTVRRQLTGNKHFAEPSPLP